MGNWIKIFLGVCCLVLAYFNCCTGAGMHAGRGAITNPATSTAALATESPSFAARWQSGKVLLDGALPNAESRARLLAQANTLYGSDGWVDQKLRVSGTETNSNIENPTGWTESALAQLAAPAKMKKLNANLPDGSGILFATKQLTVRGVFPDEPTRSKVLQEITAQLPASVTLNDLTSILGNSLNETQLNAQNEFNQAALKGIEFEVGQFDIKSKNSEQNDATISAVADVLKKYPAIKVAINGHTDSDGPLAPNLALSKGRANAVLQALVGKGIEAGRLTALGFGPNQPIAANTSPEGKARNRRIEFKVAGDTFNGTSK